MTLIYVKTLKTFSFIFSRILFSALGHSSMYHGEKGTIRIQREPIHIHDDLQRISFIDFLKRIHVSLISAFNNKWFLPYCSYRSKWVHLLNSLVDDNTQNVSLFLYWIMYNIYSSIDSTISEAKNFNIIDFFLILMLWNHSRVFYRLIQVFTSCYLNKNQKMIM